MQRPCKRGAILAPVALVALLLPGAPALAGWERFGSAGTTLGLTNNPSFEGGCNPNYNPDSPLCLLPRSDPRYDPIVCEPTISGDAIQNDFMGTVSLTGGLLGTWGGTTFDLVYSPGFYLYQTGDLNKLSHALLSKWSHSAGPRGTMVLAEDFSYTPEQEVDPNALSEGRVLLTRTDRLTSDMRASYDHETTARTSLGAAYRWSIRDFGSERFTDSVNHDVGLKFTGRFNTRTSLSVGYNLGTFAFNDGINPAADNLDVPPPPPPPPPDLDEDFRRPPRPPRTPDPVLPAPIHVASHEGLETPLDTVLHQAYVGIGYDTTDAQLLQRPRPGRPTRERRRGFTFGLSGGYHRLISPDSEEGIRTSPYVDTSVAWHTLPVSMTFGYVRGLTDGGGAFANAEMQNVFADMRLHVAPKWGASLAGSYLLNDRVEFNHAGPLEEARVQTVSTRAGMEYDLTEHWILNGAVTYFHQEIDGDPCAVLGRTGIPELSSFRLSAGFVWVTK